LQGAKTSLFEVLKGLLLPDVEGAIERGDPFDGWSLDDRDPQAIAQLMPIWEWFYRYYFRVTSDGWQHVPPTGQFLIVGSHNGGLAAPDMFMGMYDWFRRFGTDRAIYGLMHPMVWKVFPEMARQATICGAVQAHPRMAIAAFRRGASVLVFPGGAQDVFRPHALRDRIYFHDRKGFIKLALREGVPILPFVSHGAHDTLFVLGDLYDGMRQLHEKFGMPWLFGLDPEVFPVYVGLPWLLAIGPLPNFPLPAQIHTRFCEPIAFDRSGPGAAHDRDYVDKCYDRVVTAMQRSLDDLIVKVEGRS